MSRILPSLRTVTSNDEEFIIVSKVVDCHVGESSNNLLLWGQVGALLELEVSDGSAEREVAVYSAKVDESAGCAYPCLFTLVLRLVVE